MGVWLKKLLLQQLAHKRFLEHLHKTRHNRHFKAFSALNLPEQGCFWECLRQLKKIFQKFLLNKDFGRYVAFRCSFATFTPGWLASAWLPKALFLL